MKRSVLVVASVAIVLATAFLVLFAWNAGGGGHAEPRLAVAAPESAASPADLAIDDVAHVPAGATEPRDRVSVAATDGSAALTEAACTIRLLVRDEVTGEPLAGVRVLGPRIEPRAAQEPAADDPHGHESHGVERTAPRSELDAVATTELDGVALVPATRSFEYVVDLELDGYGPASVQLSVAPCGATVEAVLRASASVRGVIHGADPASLEVTLWARARGLLQPANAHLFSDETRSWRTDVDRDGHFELTGLPAEVPLIIGAGTNVHDYEVLQHEALVLAPGSVTEVAFDWSKSAALWGTVVDPEGAPVVGLQVDLMMREGVRRVETDGAGRYRFADLRPGGYVLGNWPLEAEARRFEREHVELRRGESREVHLVATTGVYVTGRVVRGDGSLFADYGEGQSATSVLSSGRDRDMYAVCDANGVFRLGPLLPGRCEIRVLHVPDPAHAPGVSVVVDAPAEDVELRCPEGGRVSCRIVDADGEVLLGAVSLRDASGREHPSLQTESGAAHVFAPVAPGRHAIHVVARDGRVGVDGEVVVRAGETTEVTIRAAAAGALVVGAPRDRALSVRVITAGFALEDGDRLSAAPGRARHRFHVPEGAVVAELVHTANDGAQRVLATREVFVSSGGESEVTFE